MLQSCTATYFLRRFLLVSIWIPLNFCSLQFSAAHSTTFNRWVIYHPPASNKPYGTSSDFFVERECLFTEASISVIPTIIVGDFNVNFDDETKSEPFRNLLVSFNLLQHVHSPTHTTGHTLDLVKRQDRDNLVSSVVVYPDSISEHYRIELTLNALKPSVETAVIAKRNFRNMDTAAFRDDIKSACAGICAQADGQQAEELVKFYNTCLSHCLYKHALWRYVLVNAPHPWNDAEIHDVREKIGFSVEKKET